MTNRSNIK